MLLFDWLVGVPSPSLETERVRLHAPRMSDFEEWREVREASRAFLSPWEPRWAADELSRKSYVTRLTRYRHDARERTSLTFFLRERASGALCGGITLGQIRRGVSQSAVLGYWMGEAFAGRGLMADAVRRLGSYAFEVEGLHRLEAACLPTNRRSIRLLEKCGFAHEGHLRKYLMIDGVWEDHRLYSLLAGDRAASAEARDSLDLPAAIAQAPAGAQAGHGSVSN